MTLNKWLVKGEQTKAVSKSRTHRNKNVIRKKSVSLAFQSFSICIISLDLHNSSIMQEVSAGAGNYRSQ